jgi:hypothetical protein
VAGSAPLAALQAPANDLEFETGQLVQAQDIIDLRTALLLRFAKYVAAAQGVTSAIPAFAGMQLHTNGTFSVQPGIAGEWVFLQATFCDALGSNLPIPVNAPGAALRVDAVFAKPNVAASTQTALREIQAPDGSKSNQPRPYDQTGIVIQYVAGVADGSGNAPAAPDNTWTLFATISVPPTAPGINAANINYQIPIMSPVGPKGDPGNAGQNVAFLGGWSATTAYAPPNVVSYQNALYGATGASTNIAPTALNAPWVLLIPAPQKGDKGDQGVGIVGRGPWSGSTAYAVNNLVSYTDGNSYLALTANIGIPPAIPSATWMVMGTKGAPGLPGDPGGPGVTGPPPWTTTTAGVAIVAAGGTVNVPVANNLAFPTGTFCILSDNSRSIYGEVISGTNPLLIAVLQVVTGTVGAVIAAGATLTFAGAPGGVGPEGPDGPMGPTPWTNTTAPVTIPGVGQNTSVVVANPAAFPVGAYLIVSDGTQTMYGEVVGESGTTLTVQNQISTTGTIASGATVTFSGPQVQFGTTVAPKVGVISGGSGSVSMTLPSGQYTIVVLAILAISNFSGTMSVSSGSVSGVTAVGPLSSGTTSGSSLAGEVSASGVLIGTAVGPQTVTVTVSGGYSGAGPENIGAGVLLALAFRVG